MEHEDEGLGQAGPSTGSGKEAVSAGIKARTTDSQNLRGYIIVAFKMLHHLLIYLPVPGLSCSMQAL